MPTIASIPPVVDNPTLWQKAARATRLQMDHGYQEATPGYPSFASKTIRDNYPNLASVAEASGLPVVSDAASLARGLREGHPFMGALAALPFVPGVVSKVARKVEEAPEVVNRLYGKMPWHPEFPPGSTAHPWGVRNVFSPEELHDIVDSGYLRPAPKMTSQGRKDKFFTLTDEAVNNTLRVPSNKIPVGRAVSARDVEILHKGTNEYVPFPRSREELAKMGY